MKRKLFGQTLTFLAATGLALTLPAACAGRGTAQSVAPAGASASSPAVIAQPPNLSILPHPAFAFADPGGHGASIADIAEKAAPSVVNVASSRTVKLVKQGMPFFEDPFFRRFFGPGMGGGGQEPQEDQRQKEHGLGSGVIVSDGIVLTNNHVVDGADEIKVTTSDKREFAAKVLGTDAKSDVAVLKLQGDTKGLTPLTLGDSSRLRLGDVVLAIGNPFGVGQTITMGIVSAKGRANVGIAAYEDFIQTDAAINPGNSGGALVDMEGHLVGINTAILSRSGGNMGIGFAIPTNMAQPIMQSLIDHGKVVRGWLGVTIQDIDQDLASALKLTDVRGILISDAGNGPGAKAGLQSGDVVRKLDGVPVESVGGFRNAIAADGTGKTVKLEIIREGKPMTVDAKLGELPLEKGEAGSRSGPVGATQTPSGLSLSDLSPGLRQKLDLPAGVKGGAVIEDVDPSSASAAAGLRPGDVIVEVDHQGVADVAKFKEIFGKAKGSALLRVVREGKSFYVAVHR